MITDKDIEVIIHTDDHLADNYQTAEARLILRVKQRFDARHADAKQMAIDTAKHILFEKLFGNVHYALRQLLNDLPYMTSPSAMDQALNWKSRLEQLLKDTTTPQ